MRKVPLTVFLLTVLALSLLIPSCKKSDSSPSGPETAITELKANGTLAPTSRTQIQGNVFVSDQTGAPITGLAATNFSARLLYGPGISKTTADSIVGTVTVQGMSQSGKKVAVAMTMDYSGSMFNGAYDNVAQQYTRILDMQRGVKAFVTAMTAGDVAEVIKFGSDVDFVVPFTSSKTCLTTAADSSCYSRGNTALYSSIYKGLQDAGAQSASTYARAVVAFTDGGENNSTVYKSDIYSLAKGSGIPVYTVGLIDSAYHSVPPGLNSREEQDLVEIADTTGGLYYYAPNAAQLSLVYQQISGTIANSVAVVVTWPSSGLPAAGTTVRLVMTVTYNGISTQIIKTFVMP